MGSRNALHNAVGWMSSYPDSAELCWTLLPDGAPAGFDGIWLCSVTESATDSDP